MRVLLFLLTLLVLALPVRAETYKDSENGFTLEIPLGWTEMVPSDVVAAVRMLSPDPNLNCYAGFEHGDSGLMLISAMPYPENKTYETLTVLQIKQIASALTQINVAEFHSANGPAVANMGSGTTRMVTYFTKPPGFVVDYRRSKLELRSHSVAFLGHDRIVMLNFFVKPVEYPFVQHSIDELAGGFKFSMHQSLNTKTSFNDPNDSTTWGIYLFVAMLVAAAGYIVRYLFKRRAY